MSGRAAAVELLKSHEIMALRFLERGGPHTMEPVVEDENTMAAALLFSDLKRRGLVICEVGNSKDRGPTYTLTSSGRRALAGLRELVDNAG